MHKNSFLTPPNCLAWRDSFHCTSVNRFLGEATTFRQSVSRLTMTRMAVGARAASHHRHARQPSMNVASGRTIYHYVCRTSCWLRPAAAPACAAPAWRDRATVGTARIRNCRRLRLRNHVIPSAIPYAEDRAVRLVPSPDPRSFQEGVAMGD